MRHVLKVERRKLSCRDAYIVANGIESDTIALCLDREWNGLRIVLTMGEGDTAVMTEVDGGEVYVPSTLLRRPGYLPVTVAGYGEGAKRILTARADRLFRVVPSGCFDGNDPVPEQPDLLSQLLAAEAGANEAAERADAAADNADAAAKKADESAKRADESAKRADESAKGADEAAEDARNAAQAAGEKSLYAYADPENDELIILEYPAFLESEDGGSVYLTLEGSDE